jgi:hypothetical protein
MKTRHPIHTNYEVYSEGYVISYKRPNYPKRLKPLKTSRNHQVNVDGKLYLMQRFIWEAFRGEIPKGHVIYFKDNDNTNFSLDNLGMRTKEEHQSISLINRWRRHGV